MLASGVLLLLALAFFSTPLARLGRSYYSSADLSQETELTRSLEGARAKNPLLSDPPVQMQPWLMLNRDELASGRVPLWNAWNGAGVPHLANYQSAVFSPFSVPFYVLGFRWALLVAALAKILGLGLFTYLVLRAVELGRLAALLGAVAFAFSGANVLLLGYPHSAVAVTLPASLYFAERAIRSAGRGAGWLLGLALCLALGLLAGHPEPFCFALLLLAAYATFRLIGVWRSRRAEPGGTAHVLRLALALAAAGALGAGLAAVQVVPFLEYLAHSTTLAHRLQGQPSLELANWPLWFFPDALGNPSWDRVLAFDLPHPNYEDVNTAYVGGLVLWLGLLGLFVARSRLYLFFAALAGLWIAYGYDVLGLGRLVCELPLASAVPMNRSQILGAFCTSACAALCADRLFRGPPLGRRALALATAAAVVLGIGSWLAAKGLLARSTPSNVDPALVVRFHELVAQHDLWVAVWLVAGAAAALAAGRIRGARVSSALGAALVAAVFLACGFSLRDYNPTIDDGAFYPRTPSVAAVQAAVGDRRVMVAGERCLPPDANLPYGIRLAASYDALWVQSTDEVYRALFDSHDNWRSVQRVDEKGLKLFGIEYVLTSETWPRTATDPPEETGGDVVRVAMAPGHFVRQTFVAPVDRMRMIELRVSQPREGVQGSLVAKLEDVATGAEVAAGAVEPVRSTPAGEAKASERGWRPSRFVFDPIEGSLGRRYRLSVTFAGPAPKRPVFVLVGSQRRSADDVLELDDRAVPSRLLLECRNDLFEPVLDTGPYALFRYRASRTPYFCVDRAVHARTDAEALERVLAPDTDPYQVVVLGGTDATTTELGASGSPDPADPPVVVLEDAHTRTVLRVERDRPGYLVLARSHYPGWRAVVDGAERPLLRANYGFCAVELGAGTSTVELEYAPRSFAIGLGLTGASAIGLLAWAARSALARRSLRVTAA